MSKTNTIEVAFARFNTIIMSKALDAQVILARILCLEVSLGLYILNGEQRRKENLLLLRLRKNLVYGSVRLPEVKMKSTPWRLETSRSSSRSSLREEVDSADNSETTKRIVPRSRDNKDVKNDRNCLDAAIQISYWRMYKKPERQEPKRLLSVVLEVISGEKMMRRSQKKPGLRCSSIK
ncbi:hypothetical protein Tco_0473034 [Tanacetum coccineum]